MRAGAAPVGPVTVPSVTVSRGAAVVDVDSVSCSRSLPSELPASVVGGGGLTAATGEVDWSQVKAVRPRDDNPWKAGAVPQPGDPVTVAMDAGAGAHRVFTGAVEDSAGGSGQGVSSSLVDHIYRLSRKVSVEPLLRLMPPDTEGGNFRRIGLTYVYVIDRALRTCRYHATPPADYDTAVSATLQGSVWPEHGFCIGASNAGDTGNAHAAFAQADGRLYAHDFTAAYTPRGTPKPITTAVQVSVTVGADHSGLTRVWVRYGDDAIELHITATGNAQARYNGVVVVPNVPGRGQRVSLLVKDGAWTLRTSAGSVVGGTQALSGATVMSSVNVDSAPGARVAGLIVSWPRDNGADEHASLGFTPTARVRPGNVSYGFLDATPAIINPRTLDVLLEVSRATCSPMWLDEDGVFQWAGPGVLRSQSPVTTVTAKDSILSLDWRVSLDHVRSRTSVAWREPRITVGRFPWVTLWEGRRESIPQSSIIREVISVPGDEDWVDVNLPARYAGVDTGGDERMNKGINSWVGGYPVAPDGGPHGGWFMQGVHGTASLERIDHGTYLHTMEVTNVPAGAEFFATEMNPASVGLWDKWDDQSLPIMRGYGKTTWGDAETEAEAVHLGSSDRPELTHDAGPWVQAGFGATPYGEGDIPGRLANWIAEQVQTPVPEVTGLEIMPDPRIQLGDVISVEDPDNVGVALTGLVTSVDVGQSGPDQSMSLGLQVISANPTHHIYDELQAAWAGADYVALEAAWDGTNYTVFESDPLEVTP